MPSVPLEPDVPELPSVPLEPDVPDVIAENETPFIDKLPLTILIDPDTNTEPVN